MIKLFKKYFGKPVEKKVVNEQQHNHGDKVIQPRDLFDIFSILSEGVFYEPCSFWNTYYDVSKKIIKLGTPSSDSVDFVKCKKENYLTIEDIEKIVSSLYPLTSGSDEFRDCLEEIGAVKVFIRGQPLKISRVIEEEGKYKRVCGLKNGPLVTKTTLVLEPAKYQGVSIDMLINFGHGSDEIYSYNPGFCNFSKRIANRRNFTISSEEETVLTQVYEKLGVTFCDFLIGQLMLGLKTRKPMQEEYEKERNIVQKHYFLLKNFELLIEENLRPAVVTKEIRVQNNLSPQYGFKIEKEVGPDKLIECCEILLKAERSLEIYFERKARNMSDAMGEIYFNL